MGGIEADDEQVGPRRHGDAQREGELDGALKLPGVGGMERVEERRGLAGDVPQLDVFIQVIGVRAQGRRGIHDLVDDDGSDLGAGVGGAEGVGFLGHEMLEAVAGDVAAKGDAVDLRAELEAVAVAGDIGAVAGEQVNLLAQGTERESCSSRCR